MPAWHEALRNDIRAFLNQLEQKHPGSKFTLQRARKDSENYIDRDVATSRNCDNVRNVVIQLRISSVKHV